MSSSEISLIDCADTIIDNRGRTCPIDDHGLPLIATNCIRNDLLHPAIETDRLVSKETYDTWFRGHPEPGDLIFVTKGSPGRVCWTPDPVGFCIAQDMVAIRPNRRAIYPKYLFAALRSPVVQQRIEGMHVGSLIPHFKKGDFDKLMIPLPDRTVQEKIGDFFLDCSERIQTLQLCSAHLEGIARSMFTAFVTDHGSEVECSRVGELPTELQAALGMSHAALQDKVSSARNWRNGSLRELVSLNESAWSAKRHPDAIDYLDLASAKENRIGKTERLRFEDAPSRARRCVRPGDTLIATVRPGNRSFAMIVAANESLTASTGFAVLSPKHDQLREFVYLASTSDESIARLARLADGGAYPAVRPDVVVDLEVPIPDDDALARFSHLTAPLFERIEVNRRLVDSLTRIRDLGVKVVGQVRSEADVSSTVEQVTAQ